MIQLRQRRIAVVAGVACAALAAGPLLPAQAAPAAQAAQAAPGPGWQLAFTEHYGGPAQGATYYDVSAAGPAAAWAVGIVGQAPSRPSAAHWNGRKWYSTPLPHGLSSYLEAVSADSAADAWAVSGLGGYLLHWHGGRWTVARTWPEHGLPSELTGVTAFSPTDVWVFGGSGAYPGLGTWHLHGTTWTKATGAGRNISFASALSPTRMWAVGGINAGADTIVRYGGGRWHYVTSKTLTGLQFQGITTLASGQVWASANAQADSFKSELVELTRTGRWIAVKVPWPVIAGKIAADGHGGLWVTAQKADGRSYLLHKTSAGHWYLIPEAPAGSAIFGLDRIGAGTSLWAAGTVPARPGTSAAIWRHR
jgi:hypothetical protein